MSKYSTNGRARRILDRLEQGPATFSELSDTSDDRGKNPRLKVLSVAKALVADGLIQNDGGLYYMLPAGRDALLQLRAGVVVRCEAEAVPSVRLFVRAA